MRRLLILNIIIITLLMATSFVTTLNADDSSINFCTSEHDVKDNTREVDHKTSVLSTSQQNEESKSSSVTSDPNQDEIENTFLIHHEEEDFHQSSISTFQNSKIKPIDFTSKSHLATITEISELKNSIGTFDSNDKQDIRCGEYYTGFIPPSQEEWNNLVGKIRIVESTRLPNARSSSLDLSTDPRFPTVGYQQQGSCAAWAATYYAAGYLQATDYNWTEASTGNHSQLLSPTFTYTKANTGWDSGSSIYNNGQVLQTIGTCRLKYLSDDTDPVFWGNESAWRDAPPFRINNIYTLPSAPYNDSEVNTVKNALQSGFPVTFALDADSYSNWGSDYVLSSSDMESGINHGNTIVGYNDSITDAESGETGAFRVVNSWGESWGDNGYYWLTYDAFKAGNIVTVTWFDDLYNTSNGEGPSLVGTWEYSSNPDRDASVELGIGTPTSPLDTRTPWWNGYSGSMHTLPSFMCLDITEFYDEWRTNITDFYLTIGDATGNDGTISSFRIESHDDEYIPGSPNRTSLNSADVPKNTPGTVTVNFSFIPPENDTGVSAINFPSNEAYYSTGMYTINATVNNYGTKNQTNLLVNCSIYNQSTMNLVYGNETAIAQLNSGTEIDIEFSKPWIVSIEGDYVINVSTNLSNDEYVLNNFQNNTVYMYNISDVGVESINYPLNQTPEGNITVNATVKNYGTLNVSFEVNCSIYTYNISGGNTWYGYNAYDPSGTMVEGPGSMDAMDPGSFSILQSTTSDDFISGGCWVEDEWYGVEFGTGSLYTIATDGTMTSIGGGGTSLNGLAYCDGTLYGASNTDFYEIDPTTGAQTLIGSLGSAGGLMIGIASDGTTIYGVDISDDSLYEIDPSTGAATLIGSTGLSLNYAQDMAYDRVNGKLYLAAYTSSGKLYECNPYTGETTFIDDFPGGAEITGFAIPYTIESDELVYWSEKVVSNLQEETNQNILFNSSWDAQPGQYLLDVSTNLTEDENTVNNAQIKLVEVMPTTVFVDDDYTNSTLGWQLDHFPSIHGGISAVAPTGTVYVYNGTYAEKVIVNKALELIGENNTETIIHGSLSDRAVDISQVNGSVIITNFTIENSDGVNIYDSNNITLTNNRINGNSSYCNVYCSESSHVRIRNNDFADYSYVSMLSSLNCDIQNNSFNLHGGLMIRGHLLQHYLHMIKNNEIMGNTIYYFKNQSDLFIDGWADVGEIILVNCSNATILNLMMNNSFVGIETAFCNDININNNTINNNHYSLYMRTASSHLHCINNTIHTNGFGVYMWSSLTSLTNNNNIFKNNVLSGQGGGTSIYCGYNSQNNVVSDNELYDNRYGVRMYYAPNNEIKNNIISNNSMYGIFLQSCTDNNIYNNYFNNTLNAVDNGNNMWNVTQQLGTTIINGSYLGGNYWSDYAGYDSDNDSIGETNLPYSCSGRIQNGGDFLPLTHLSPPDIWVHPEAFNVTLQKGIVSSDNLTIGNNGSSELTFSINQGASMNQYVTYNDGATENSLGLTNGGNITMAIELTSAELAGFYNQQITTIKFAAGCDDNGPTVPTDYEIWIDTSKPAVSDLYDGSVSIYKSGTTDDTVVWQNVSLDTNYNLPNAGSVFIGINYRDHAAGEYPCGMDEDTTSPPRGGLLTYEGSTWTDLGSAGLPGVWGINVGIGNEVSWLSVFPTTGSLQPDNQTNVTVTFNATHLEEGWYNTTMAIENNDYDENPVNVSINLTVTQPSHDIAVTNMTLANSIELFEETVVNATLENKGLHNETNLAIQLVVNDTVVNNTQISCLNHSEIKNVSLSWIPNETGEVPVSIYVVPVAGENITYNNIMTQNVSIISFADIWVNPSEFNVTMEKGTVYSENLTIGNNGTDPLTYNLSIGITVFEDFDGSFPPTGWYVEGANNGDNWRSSNSADAGGTAPEAEFFWSPSTVGTQRLVSKTINTEGFDTLNLSFKQYLDDYSGGGYTLGVATTCDGNTWNDAWAVTPTTDIAAETVEIQISTSDVGSSQFQLCFYFDGDSFDLNWWNIDDVHIKSNIDIYDIKNDIIFSDDFEDGASEWTIYDDGNDGVTWFCDDDMNPYGLDLGGATGSYMHIDDDYDDTNIANNEQLITPTLNCTKWENIMVDFDGDFEAFLGNGDFFLDVFDGSNWITIWYLDDDYNPGGSNTGFNQSPLLPWDISSYADGNPNFQLRFRYSDENNATYGMLIDNVVIKGDRKWSYFYPPPSIVDPGNQTNVSITFNATNLDVGSYHFPIYIMSNDPDENPVIIPVNLNVTHPEHDIAVTTMNVVDTLNLSEETPVNATILNNGLFNESNIQVQLLVNNTVVNSTTLAMLNFSESENVSFTWIPNETGDQEVSVYSVPVPHENVTFNNKMSSLVTVIASTVYVDDDYNSSTPGWQQNRFNTIQEGVDNVNSGGIVLVYNGTYIENVIIDKPLNLIGENTTTTVINGSSNGYAIELDTVEGVVITNMSTQQSSGIGIFSSIDIMISHVSVDGSIYCSSSQCCLCNNTVEDDLALVYSDYSVVEDNVFSRGGGIVIRGSVLDDFIHDVHGNTVDGKTIYYFANQTNLLIDNWTDVGEIILVNCTSSDILNNEINGSYVGLETAFSDYISINNNTFTDNYYGLYMRTGSTNNTIENNTLNVDSGWYGIYVYSYSSSYQCENNFLLNNTIYGDQGSGYGLYCAYQTKENTIKGNSVKNLYCGSYFSSSNGNTIHDNMIINNSQYGLYMSSSNNNIIYNNYFNNTINAYGTGNNIWNVTQQPGTSIINAPYLGGNYWSDYQGYDIDNDSIGETNIPYTCSGNIQHGGDYLPLTHRRKPDIWVDPNQINETLSENTTICKNLTIGNDGNGTLNYQIDINYERYTLKFDNFSTQPVNWTITHLNGTAWEWDSTDEQMENSYGFTEPNAGYLDSPRINCSHQENICLSFWHHWEADWATGNQNGYVRGSIDNGSTYPYLIDEFHHNNPALETGVKTYECPWATNQSSVKIRFDVYNDNDWYWHIDDFHLYSEGTHWCSVNQTNGTISPGKHHNISVCLNSSALNTGLYNISVNIENNDLDENPIIIPVSLNVTEPNIPPTANFSYYPVNPTINDTIQFTDHSVDIDGSIVSWNWDFDDGNSSTMQYPSHNYSNPGTYIVCLNVSDDEGSFNQYCLPIHVTAMKIAFNISLKTQWNLVAIPINQSVNKENMTVCYSGSNHTWTEAVGDGMILDFMYAWDSSSQSYTTVGTCEPGQGYWVYAYGNCSLLVTGERNDDDYITDLLVNWNLVGVPFNSSVAKDNLTVTVSNGTCYPWVDAVSSGIVLDFIYGWDPNSQSYTTVEILEEDMGYWLYSYENCTLHRSN